MQLKDYFEKTDGIGVLSTADAGGRVDAAIYSRPHVMEDGTVAFVMRDRLSRHNLLENPSAVFLFVEEGRGYKGLRLFLEKTGEETDNELIEQMTRRCLSKEEDEARGPKFLVTFEIKKMLELIGDGQPDVTL
ncbi:MAG: pyridoxamine 5'-phosphate oxidase family protein [Desulfuromonadales bacterium]|nr:pyridoxamine 5'-phosphate oxidase family protein [Desulfuromonadales bacterium]NIS42425.1 pyridoxamine 5'-phosphate oxidase family protein [Desulfuromonadales bacterium]